MAIFQNGSFEFGTAPGSFLPLQPGARDIVGWEVISSFNNVPGGIDYVGTFWPASHGNRSLDLNGTPGVGGVAQTFDSTPNQTYHVQFDMAGHFSGLPQEMRVSAAGQQ